MTGRRLDLPDVLFGLFLAAVSGGALLLTRHLRGGTAADMGPGYMPRAIAVALLLFGLFFLVRGALAPWRGIDKVHLRPLVAICAGVAVFAAGAASLGLAIVSVLTVVVAGMGSPEARLWQNLAFGLALSAASVGLFVKLLSLPVPVWPW
ncbi:tripartite tricarboxylate transporter TctB family protein [Azorhizobium sp. AG788]|uniref:tripartite tricarboxylate transporter TctB family protein n=1 Tax=Azorhizobium sp. AG788 TaxID=2183897 RepID=UPI003138840E